MAGKHDKTGDGSGNYDHSRTATPKDDGGKHSKPSGGNDQGGSTGGKKK